MRKMLLLGVCFLSATMACAQSAEDAFAVFRNTVLKQRFMLRNFSGERNVYAVWTGTQFETDSPKWHTMGVIQVDSVKMRGGSITLDCSRHVLVWNKEGKLAFYDVLEPMQISIDLAGGDPVQLLPKLRDALFYSSTADGLAAVPELLKKVVPRHESLSEKPNGQQTISCDCNRKESCASGARDDTVAPKLLHYSGPEFTDEARRRKFNGKAVVSFVVDESGRPTDIWVTRPLALGMSEEAAKTVSSYTFQPATCHSKPVSVAISSEVSFQMQ